VRPLDRARSSTGGPRQTQRIADHDDLTFDFGYDFDADGDGVPNARDNCPDKANAGQLDSDRDGQGDVCDATPYLVGDTVFADTNRDGTQQPGESGITGVRVQLIGADGS